MKRILLSLVALCTLVATAGAQGKIAGIWTQPAIFVANEEVTIFFDVTGTALAGEAGPIYLWSWFPSEPDAGNWASSSEFARLTQVEGNVWKITMTPTEYYNKPAADVFSLYGLLKLKDGSKVTDAFAPDMGNAVNLYDMNSIKGSKIIDFYPKTIPGDKPFSILLNTNNTWSGCDPGPGAQGALSTASNVHIHSGLNDWAVIVENNPTNADKTKLTDLGDGIYRMDMIPREYYGQQVPIKKLNAVFANQDWSKLGFDKNCADFLLTPIGVEPVEEGFAFFPQKLTQKDLFSVIAVNDNGQINALSYTITAGDKTIQGAFEGARPTYQAYIDLATNLKGVTGLTKFHLTVKGSNGSTLLDTDFSLIDAAK